MKPRQTGKLYPVSNVPPYQDLPTSSSSLSVPMREDLAKLGIKLDDNVVHNVTAKTDSSPSQEEIAEFIQNLQSNVQHSYKMNNKDRPVDYSAFQTMQPWLMNLTERSPPPQPTHNHGHLGRKGRGGGMRRSAAMIDPYTATTGGPVAHGSLNGVSPMNTMSTGGNSSINSLSNIMNVGGLAGGLAGTNSNTISGHHKQNIQFTNNSSNNAGNVNSTGACSGGGIGVGGLSASNSSASHHAHQPTPAINHFRLSSTNIHSPQQQLSQQKSVLSLHQQHQNDLSSGSSVSRRLNHHLNTTNASFANLQAAVNAPTATSTSNLSLSDNNVDLSNALSNNTVTSKNHNPSSNLSTVGGSAVPNIMDTLGSMDPLFNDVSQITNPDTPTHYHQSMIKHQQLQKLLKAKNSQVRPLQPSLSCTTLTQRSDSHQLSPGKTLNTTHQLLPPPPSPSPANSISPPQPNFSSVPKSLLNLAACSPSSLGRPTNPASTITSSGPSHPRSSQKQFAKSLLLDDQSSIGGRSGTSEFNTTSAFSKPTCNANSSNVVSSKLTQFSQTHNLTKRSTIGSQNRDSNLLLNPPGRNSSAVSSLNDNINKQDVNPNQQFSSAAISQANNLPIANQSREECVDFHERREIESALSRVEARNDLSLLYPPMILAPNSQKQINALSAGLQMTHDSELFTKEVKRIVLEECNIIYECKGCNNLFRSLANLVKHKRTYCVEKGSERSTIEMNKRPSTNLGPTYEQNNLSQSDIITSLRSSPQEPMQISEAQEMSSTSLLQEKIAPSSLLASHTSSGSWRSSNQDDSRLRRLIKTKTFNYQTRDLTANELHSKTKSSVNESNASSSRMQTSLCRLLQSQPKSLLPPIRDSALAGALNMASPVAKNEALPESVSSILDGDRETDYSTSGINEHLVRNSSLAKTLLSEKARVSLNPRQSLIELSKAELASNPNNSTSGPKRKFLEDCIRKVRRDKLLTDNESHLQMSSRQLTLESSSTTTYNPTNSASTDKSSTMSQNSNSDLSKLNSPSESELDSDSLMIDLDGSQKGESPAKKARCENDSGPSTSSTSKFKSSVLLKALTRPVDAKSKSKTCEPVTNPVKESPKESKEVPPSQEIQKEDATHKTPKKGDSKDTVLETTDVDNEDPNLCTPENESTSDVNDDENNEDAPDIESRETSQSCSSPRSMSDEDESERGEPENGSPLSERSVTSKRRGSFADESATPPHEPQEPSETSISSPLFDKYTCDICDTDFQHNWQLLAHITRRHRDEAMIYPCIFCSLSFLTLENVCRHIIDTHKKPRTQVDRLKDVVKSRSYLKSDLEGCQDFPSNYEVSEPSDSMGDKEIHDPKEGDESNDDVPIANDVVKEEEDFEDDADADEDDDDDASQEACTSGQQLPSDNPGESIMEPEECHLSDSSSTSSNTAQKMSSSRSSGGSGGIMKLKIQLKTRPDDKNKVYEIV